MEWPRVLQLSATVFSTSTIISASRLSRGECCVYSQFYAALSQRISNGASGLYVPRRLETLAGEHHQSSGL